MPLSRRFPVLDAWRGGALALAFSTLAGCGVTPSVGRPSEVPSGALRVSDRAAVRCVHGTPGRNSPYRVHLPHTTEDKELAAHLARFPKGVR